MIREQAPDLYARIKPSEPLKVEAPLDPGPQVPVPAVSKKSNTSFFVALSLDILGAAALGFGAYQHSQKNKLYDDYLGMSHYLPQKDYDSALQKANDAQKMRDVSLAVGGALLLSGIAVHIWF